MVQQNTKDFSDVDKFNPKSLIQYIENISESEVAKTIGRTIHSNLKLVPGQKVADLGCGTGKDITLILEDVGQDGHVSGIDFSEEMIKHCKLKFQANDNVSLYVGSADDTKLESNYFDVVRCERLLQHVPSPQKVVDEMVRLAVHGGMVSVVDTDWDSSRVSCHDPELKDIARRVFSARFNCHPDVGLDLQRIFSMTPQLERINTKGYLLTTASFETAKTLYVFEVRVQRAVDQGLISQAEQARFLQCMQEYDDQGKFYFTMNYFNAIGYVNKTQ
eukprot:gene1159-1328_t